MWDIDNKLLGMTEPVSAATFAQTKRGQWIRIHWLSTPSEWGVVADDNYAHRKRVFIPLVADYFDIEHYRVSIICNNGLTGILPHLLGNKTPKISEKCYDCKYRFRCFTECE